MKRFFIGLFFKFYALAKRTGNKDESDAMFTALCAVTALISFNIISIAIYLECLLLSKGGLITSKAFQLFVLLFVGGVVYFVFMNKKNMSIYI